MWPRAARMPSHAPAIIGREAGAWAPSQAPLPWSPLRASGKMQHASEALKLSSYVRVFL